MVQIKFKVSCFDENYDWQETDRRTVEQGNSGMQGHRLLMKEKWFTPDFAIPVVRDPIQSECPVLSRFITSRQAELVLSCEEFIERYQNPEDLIDQCNAALADASPQTEPTGEEIDLCGKAE